MIQEFGIEEESDEAKAYLLARLAENISGRTLFELSKKNYIYVISSNSGDAINKVLKEFDIDCIKGILGGDVEKSKVAKILKLKKENKGKEIFYIGDTTGDITEAKKAKVKNIAVTWGVHSKKQLEEVKPDYIVNEPEELLSILS